MVNKMVMEKVELLLELWIYGIDFTKDLVQYIKNKQEDTLYDATFDEAKLSSYQQQYMEDINDKVKYSVEELENAMLIYYPDLSLKLIGSGVAAFVKEMESRPRFIGFGTGFKPC